MVTCRALEYSSFSIGTGTVDEQPARHPEAQTEGRGIGVEQQQLPDPSRPRDLGAAEGPAQRDGRRSALEVPGIRRLHSGDHDGPPCARPRAGSTPPRSSPAPPDTVTDMTLVEVTDADGVRLVRWNRPEALNAFNDEVWDATRNALTSAQASPDAALRRAHRDGASLHVGTGPRRDDGAARARRRRASRLPRPHPGAGVVRQALARGGERSGARDRRHDPPPLRHRLDRRGRPSQGAVRDPRRHHRSRRLASAAPAHGLAGRRRTSSSPPTG